jgi:hypothetical protein
MQSWDDEFGYELVEADKSLDFGPVDAALAAHLQRTLATARAQYTLLRESVLAQQRRMESLREEPAPAGLRASPNGGFIASGTERSSNAASRANSDATDPGGLAQRPAGSDAARAQAFPTGESESRTDPLSPSQPRPQATLAEMTNPANGKTPPDKLPPAGDSKSNQGQASAKSTSSADGAADSGSASVPALAESRGQNWALPSYHPNATAYRRPVLIECRSDGLWLDMGPVGGGRRQIPYRDTLEPTIDQMVDAIWTLIKSWGIAERNGYWLPELRFIVHPEGRDRFLQLRELLAGSGLDLTEVSQ